ncbi:MAG: hypothetical protein AABX54_01610 [Nanoarchaeota archaeon]
MTDYICSGCNNQITEGAVATTEGLNPLYFHVPDNRCIDAYNSRAKSHVITLRILPFSELEKTAQTPV